MTPAAPQAAPGRLLGGLVLAAGRGTRLRPLTDVVPKPAVPILDVPLAAFAVAALARCCTSLAVNVSHLGDVVIQALAPHSPSGTTYLREVPEPLGSGGTLAEIRGLARDPVVTRNSDMLTDLDMARLLHAHRRNGAAATVAVRRVSSGGDFELAGDQIVELINRRAHPGRAGFEFIGTTIFSAPALEVGIGSPPVDLVSAFLVPLLERRELAAFVHSGYALDVGTVERYLQANLDVLDGVAPAPPTRFPGAIVEVAGGRAYVGAGADVQRAELGPGAIVLAGATARRCRIHRSVVWPGEVVDEDLDRTVFAFGRKLL